MKARGTRFQKRMLRGVKEWALSRNGMDDPEARAVLIRMAEEGLADRGLILPDHVVTRRRSEVVTALLEPKTRHPD